MTPRGWAALVLVLAFAGVRPASAGVYGIDDRHHVYLEEDPLWHDLAARSVIAELRSGWALCDGTTIAPTQTLGEFAELCPGEAFEHDPVVTSCSATLIDDDLIVTAHHCIDDDGCATAAFAPGLLFSAEDELASPGQGDIYTCRRVVAETEGVDIAIVQLDRPVAGDYVPATLGPTPDEGAEIGVIGFPTYTPMKIARGCTVRDLHAGLVRHDCDTFHGNSGSGVFDGDGALFGVHVLVVGDYDKQGDCYVTKVYTQDGLIPGVPSAPQFGAAARIDEILPVLCESGWPTPLCGTEASCGDGTCSGGETAVSCDSDCEPPVCGDGICEVSVELACEQDCGHLTAGCPGGGDTDGASTSSDAGGSGSSGVVADTSGSGSSSTPGDATGSNDTRATGTGAASDDGGEGCGCHAPAAPRWAPMLWWLIVFPRARTRRFTRAEPQHADVRARVRASRSSRRGAAAVRSE